MQAADYHDAGLDTKENRGSSFAKRRIDLLFEQITYAGEVGPRLNVNWDGNLEAHSSHVTHSTVTHRCGSCRFWLVCDDRFCC